MEIKITENNDRLVAMLSGELDNIASIAAKKALAPLLEQNDHDVVVDCADLTYISSSGLRLFINIYNHQHSIGRRSIIAHVKDNVKDVFEIGGFLMLFELED
jgi:anti-sigma B factor antagonist